MIRVLLPCASPPIPRGLNCAARWIVKSVDSEACPESFSGRSGEIDFAVLSNKRFRCL